jgi:FkbM family methyltransferase
MTLGFARKGAARIWAFEPARRNREVLTRNIAANRMQNVTVFDVALSDAPGESTISFDPVRPSKASLGPGTERVRVATLDEFSLDPDLLKIDVEGFELPVLQGAVATLRRRRPNIVLELHGHTMALKKSKTDAILRFLKKHGYEATHIESQQPADADRHYEGHLFARSSAVSN